MLDAASSFALRIGPRNWLIAGGTAIAFLGVMGILRFAHKDALRAFNLDGEYNVPATFSAVLWVCVAALAFLVGRSRPVRGRPWKILAALFLFLAADEFAQVHEHLQFYAGVDWQILYLPVALVAGVFWIAVGRQLFELATGFGAFVGATVCGIAAQPLEALQTDSHANPRPGFRVMVVSEELLEMAAAVLLAFAFLAALQALGSRPTSASA